MLTDGANYSFDLGFLERNGISNLADNQFVNSNLAQNAVELDSNILTKSLTSTYNSLDALGVETGAGEAEAESLTSIFSSRLNSGPGVLFEPQAYQAVYQTLSDGAQQLGGALFDEPILGAAGQAILRDSAIITAVLTEADAAQAFVDARNNGQSVLDSDWAALQAGGQSLWNTGVGLYNPGSTVLYYAQPDNAAAGVLNLANYVYNNSGNAANWVANTSLEDVANGAIDFAIWDYNTAVWALNGVQSFVNNDAQLVTANADAITKPGSRPR